jgi:hypothetical protein
MPKWTGMKSFWRERSRFHSLRDWGVLLYSRVIERLPLRYRFTAPLPFRGCICRMRLIDQIHPFYVRLGTTDPLVLESMFIRRAYDNISGLGLGDVKLIVDLGANVGTGCMPTRRPT